MVASNPVHFDSKGMWSGQTRHGVATDFPYDAANGSGTYHNSGWITWTV
jgi:hypothetical protein